MQKEISLAVVYRAENKDTQIAIELITINQQQQLVIELDRRVQRHPPTEAALCSNIGRLSHVCRSSQLFTAMASRFLRAGVQRSLLTIGLTGGIASGKSHVARDLETSRGAHRLDADRLAHALYAPGTPTHAAIVRAFGPDVVASDGSIARAVLGARVFADADEMRRLVRALLAGGTALSMI